MDETRAVPPWAKDKDWEDEFGPHLITNVTSSLTH